jgi:ComF family protein
LPLLPTINEGPAFENMLQCGRCVAKPPPFTRSLSVFVYDDKSRSFIFRLKHGKDLSLVPLLARWLYVRGRLIWSGCDVIVPVPLHWTRMAWRSFNQSALLTRGLSRLTGLPHNPSLLKRVKRTPPQGHLTVHQRADNVRHAFRVNQKHLESLQGARVVLVDDVYTTGATLTACARTLLRAGAQSVSVLTLARVAHNPFDA